MDLLTTVCDLAGIEIPKTVDRKGFAAVLKGEKEVIRDLMYGVDTGGRKPGTHCKKRRLEIDKGCCYGWKSEGNPNF